MSIDSGTAGDTSRKEVVYLVKEGHDDPDDALDLRQLLRALWHGKWFIVGTALLFSGLGVAYALMATPWYRAQVTMIPVDQRASRGMASQLGQFGGLASLAGIDIGGADKTEPLAVLRSRAFAQGFIEQKKLLTVLFADKWDDQQQKWKVTGTRQPDLRDAVDYFDKKVRVASEDKKAGLTILTVTWKDPALAADWANEMADLLNAKLRDRALKDATTSLAYLQEEMQSASQVSLQQAIGRLMEGELEKLMLARGSEEFAFRVIDRAQTPKRRYKPQRRLVVVLSALVGLLTGSMLVIGRAMHSGGLVAGAQRNA